MNIRTIDIDTCEQNALYGELKSKFKDKTMTPEEAIFMKYMDFVSAYQIYGSSYESYNSPYPYQIVQFEIFVPENWEFRNAYKDILKKEGFKLYHAPLGEWIEYVSLKKVLAFLPKLKDALKEKRQGGSE
jgi:hypothetical protein